MTHIALSISAQLFLFLVIQAKIFDRCQLASELTKQGFPRDQLADWVCLVEAESSRQTHKMSPMYADTSRRHGLFQINDRFWCENKKNTPGKKCNVKCSDIRTDDIGAASNCAKLIFSERGFAGWSGWIQNCRGQALPDLKPCGF